MVKSLQSWATAYATAVFWLLLMTTGIYLRLVDISFVIPPIVRWLTLAFALVFLLMLMIGLLRKKVSYIWWEVLLLFLAVAGVWLLFLAILPVWLAVILASIFTLLEFFLPLVFMNTGFLLFGATGLGLVIAMRFPLPVMLIAIFGVGLYEFRRHVATDMASLVSESWKVGLPPGPLLPFDWQDWFKSIDDIWHPGRARIVSILPFLAISAMFFQMLGHGWLLPILSVLVILCIGFVYSDGKRGNLRTWVYVFTAGAMYLLDALAKLFL